MILEFVAWRLNALKGVRSYFTSLGFPHNPNQLIYFVEVQFQKDNQFYSRFLSEIFLYLHQSDLDNNWQGVVIYPKRSSESTNTSRYQELLDSRRVSRIYLEELRQVESLGIATLQLIVAKEKKAIAQGKQIITRVRQELADSRQRRELLQLIETILVYKLPQVSREEIEAMFSLSDLKQTKVYQEALEEGIEQGIEQGIERGRQEGKLTAKLASVPRLVALGLSVEQIAQALELDIEQVRQAMPQG